MKEERNNLEKIFDGIVIFMMVIAAVFAIVQTILGNLQQIGFKLVLGLWILAAVVLADFVEPFVGRKFDDMTDDALKKYVLYAASDGAMYAFAYVFIINITLFKEPIHYIFLGLFVVMLVVRTILLKAVKSSAKEEPVTDTVPVEIKAAAETLLSDNSDDEFEEESLDEEDILKIIRYRERKNEK